MKRVAIIGGLGFVGRHLSRYLQNQPELDICIVGRNNIKVLAESGQAVYTDEEIRKLLPFDVVINLAFASAGLRKAAFQQNESLCRLMADISNDNSHIIHTSTLAVFGFDVFQKPVLAPIRLRADRHYTEHKIQMENLLQKNFKNRALDIVRLGNVVGAASPRLMAAAESVYFQKPLPKQAKDIPANLTDVQNVSSFIHALIQSSEKKGLHFHHLAEMEGVTWGRYYDAIGGLLNEQPYYIPYSTPERIGMRSALVQIMKEDGLRQMFRASLNHPALSSYSLRWVEKIFNLRGENQKGLPPYQLYSASPFDIVHTQAHEFKNEVGIPWKPELDFEASLRISGDYLRFAGYEVR